MARAWRSASGRPMDRLICGDVGFGKTEVALRASLIAVLAGKQVAVVVPTTLLARQHFHTFTERFRGFPVKISQASRLVSPKERAEVKAGIKSGDIDIVIGTHALLAKGIEFADSACSLSTRSSISACSTKSGWSSSARTCMC